MKHTLKITAVLMSMLVILGAAGCSSESKEDLLEQIDYATGIGSDLQYNNKLYGMNGSNDIEGADPGCFYVSEEEDAKYGGYYYMYKSGSTADEGIVLSGEPYASDGTLVTAYRCYRSKDLHTWETAGAMDDGYSLKVTWEDWARKNFWAPEVIKSPHDGKYYMYFSASADANWGVEAVSSSTYEFDRLYLGVAVSDTPIGPFTVLYDKDEATNKRIPTINFKTGCGTEYNWAAIDVSPFYDDNGDLYLYFNKHTDAHYDAMMGVWGMKMKNAYSPDYSTVSYLAAAGKVTASNTPGNIQETKVGEAYYDPSESGVNEAPHMIKHDGKYYLTYASNGYGQIGYSVHQAVSDNPLSGFTKLSMEQGNPVLDGSAHGQMNGTAHHAFVKNGEELWIVYHKHNSLQGNDKGWDRSISADRVNFVKNSEGMDVLTANGPTVTLQWLPENVSGYKNLAKTAKIEVNTGKGVEFLNDGILPYYTVTQNSIFAAEKEDVTITLSWEEPVSVSSIMVYNAYDLYAAFSQISKVEFKTTEKDSEYKAIYNLKLPEKYWNESSGQYTQCSPAVAEFEPIEITELKFTIRKLDRLVSEDKFGEELTALNLSEIVVLGGATNE